MTQLEDFVVKNGCKLSWRFYSGTNFQNSNFQKIIRFESFNFNSAKLHNSLKFATHKN